MASQDSFERFFQAADTNRDGTISGQEAVTFFRAFGLPQATLAKVWQFADQQNRGFLTKPDFFNALKLVTVAQTGRELTLELVQAALHGPAAAQIPPPKPTGALPGSSFGGPPSQGPAAPRASDAGGPQASSFPGGPGSQVRPPPRLAPIVFNSTAPAAPAVSPNGPQSGFSAIPTQPQYEGPGSAGRPGGVAQPRAGPGPRPAAGGLGPGPVKPLEQQGEPRGFADFGLASFQGQPKAPTQVPAGPASFGGSGSQAPGNQPNRGPSQGFAAFGNESFTVPPPSSTSEPQFFSASNKSFSNSGPPSNSTAGWPSAPGQAFSNVNPPPPSSFAAAAPKPQQGPPLSPTKDFGGSAFRAEPPSSGPPGGQNFFPGGAPGSAQGLQAASSGPAGGQKVGQQGFEQQTPFVASGPPSGGAPWPRMTVADAQRYTQLFARVDTDRDGKLTGAQARDVLLRFGPPREILKQVWVLSDQDNDGMLSLREFCTSLYLIDRVKEGRQLPPTLPAGIHFDEPAPDPRAQIAAQRIAQAQAALAQNAAGVNVPTWRLDPGMLAANISAAPARRDAAQQTAVGQMPVSAADASDAVTGPPVYRSKAPPLEPGKVNQLDKEDAENVKRKHKEAEDAGKKVFETEAELLDSKQKIEFYRTKMQEIIMFKTRCDNHLNEITERAIADKREVEELAKKYDEKYKQTVGINGRMAMEETALRDIQEKKAELMKAVVRLDQGGDPDARLQERADKLAADLEELRKIVNKRAKELGLKVRPILGSSELPFGWQAGLQENAVEWDDEWHEFDDQGFATVGDMGDPPAPPAAHPALTTASVKAAAKGVGAPVPENNARLQEHEDDDVDGEEEQEHEHEHEHEQDERRGALLETSSNEGEAPAGVQQKGAEEAEEEEEEEEEEARSNNGLQTQYSGMTESEDGYGHGYGHSLGSPSPSTPGGFEASPRPRDKSNLSKPSESKASDRYADVNDSQEFGVRDSYNEQQPSYSSSTSYDNVAASSGGDTLGDGRPAWASSFDEHEEEVDSGVRASWGLQSNPPSTQVSMDFGSARGTGASQGFGNLGESSTFKAADHDDDSTLGDHEENDPFASLGPFGKSSGGGFGTFLFSGGDKKSPTPAHARGFSAVEEGTEDSPGSTNDGNRWNAF
eukprot:jgi/Mesen1/4336/ME000022S03623